MNISMIRRLESMEQRFRPREQRIVVVQRDGETDEDMAARLERWKAGEDVPGIRSQEPYKGGELAVINVVFVEPEPR